MAGSLSGKVVLITGAESGIGRAMAHRCAAEGASVTIAAFNMDLANIVQSEIEGQGGKALAVNTDVRDPDQVNNALSRTIDAFGRIDGVIAN
ncbi:MAG: SDR family NAD(P)-dependent oxidoreductase, partial [Dehalococcoidia bacterium]|nr:SDR family NAD(P)-dependent oxidoreductase [Dehalococcoidia bacterium]